MTELIGICDVRPLEGYVVRLWFSDGAVKDVDLELVLSQGGVFKPIFERREIFEAVRVNPESETIEWPGEIDLDPDVLYGTFEPESGVMKRRTVQVPVLAGRVRSTPTSPQQLR